MFSYNWKFLTGNHYIQRSFVVLTNCLLEIIDFDFGDNGALSVTIFSKHAVLFYKSK